MTDSSAAPAAASKPTRRLDKALGLFDLYSISAAGLFSAGFFLLPALTFHYAGPSAVFAYPVAALLMLPAVLSIAELSTALPRAGGPYYFLDRALGPLFGTVAGFGTWLALVLKSGFAFIGMGAYVSLFIDAPSQYTVWMVKGLAVAMTVAFTVLNLLGAKETKRLQNLLMAGLAAVLAYYLVQGGAHMAGVANRGELTDQFQPMLSDEFGPRGFISAVALVFLTSAGLIKLASVSEEVKKPERNLPLCLFLVVGTATVVNMLGAAIMVAVLEPDALDGTLTPAADAARAFFDWLPGSSGVVLVAVAAIAAFAASGNAGILGGSRYPLAMARDRLLPTRFAVVTRQSHTPVNATLITSGTMIAFIVAFNADVVAKLASSFNLLVFAMLHVAVIVLRESRIESYDPGFKSPWYPWTQIVGGLLSFWLIIEMGWVADLFSAGIVVVGAIWYFKWARERVQRHGAIFHLFERLGRHRFDKLEYEFREILMEKGARDQDPFDDIVARAPVIDIQGPTTFEVVIRRASERLAPELNVTAEEIEQKFVDSGRYGGAPVSHGAVLPHFRVDGIDRGMMLIVRAVDGFPVEIPGARTEEGEPKLADTYAVFFLVSPESDPGMHLRILAQIAAHLEHEHFLDAWTTAPDELSLKEILMRDERYVAVTLRGEGPASELIGKPLSQATFPEGVLVAMVRREDHVFVPRGSTVLELGDRLTLLGEPAGIARAYKLFVAGVRERGKKQG